jgi:hypothetical protein
VRVYVLNAEMDISLEMLPLTGLNSEKDMALVTLPVSGNNAEFI